MAQCDPALQWGSEAATLRLLCVCDALCMAGHLPPPRPRCHSCTSAFVLKEGLEAFLSRGLVYTRDLSPGWNMAEGVCLSVCL